MCWRTSSGSGSGPISTSGCKSPLVVQLLVIALVSGVIGEFKSTAIVSRDDRAERRAVLRPRPPVQPAPSSRWASGCSPAPSSSGTAREAEIRICRHRAGRHRGTARRLDHPRRPPAARRQGLLRQPVGADRRVDAGREDRRQPRCRPAVGPGPAQRLLLRAAPSPAARPAGVVVNTGARTLFGAIAERPGRAARGDQLRPGRPRRSPG